MSEEFAAWQLPPISGDNARGATLRTARQLEDLQEQAWAEAFEQGKQEGYAAGIAAAKADAARIVSILNLLASPLEDLDETVVQQLASLATMIAAHIVRREVRQDPQQIIAVAHEAVRALPLSSREIQIRIHPEDAAILREHIGADSRWKLVEDPTLTRGGLAVSVEQSHVDMRVERRIGEIAAAMLGGERTGE